MGGAPGDNCPRAQLLEGRKKSKNNKCRFLRIQNKNKLNLRSPLILFLFFYLRPSWMKTPMFWIFSFVIDFVVSLARPTWCMSAPCMWLFIHCFMLMSGLPLGTIFTIFTTFSNFERFHYFGNILWKKSWFSWVHTRSRIYSLIFTMVDNLNAI